MKRRSLILGLSVASATFAHIALAANVRRNDPLRLGVDVALARAGAGARVQRAFGASTGLAVTLVNGPSAALLDSLEAGELDATLTFAPEIEARLDSQGLAHDRHALAEFEFVLAGPVETVKRKVQDPAGIAGGKDVGMALAQIAAGSQPYLSHGGGSGAHLLEQALWRQAHLAPAAPWSRALAADESDELAAAMREKRYVLVDRARWSAGSAKGFAALVQGDPRLRVPVQVLRPFRHQHPSGKLFGEWIASRGKAALAGPGLRVLSA